MRETLIRSANAPLGDDSQNNNELITRIVSSGMSLIQDIKTKTAIFRQDVPYERMSWGSTREVPTPGTLCTNSSLRHTSVSTRSSSWARSSRNGAVNSSLATRSPPLRHCLSSGIDALDIGPRFERTPPRINRRLSALHV